MELAILVLTLLVLLAIGTPVAFALLGASMAAFIAMDIPLIVVFQRVAAGMSVFTLMAIPFFIFAGDLMYRSGIAQRLVEVAEAMFGRSRGGLGQVTVGASTLFGAVSGSAIASASAMGSTLMPLMKEKGYDGDYAVNVTVTAAIVGLLIPPSHNMIIYAASTGTGVSIGDLFLAGIIPGVLTAALLMVVAWVVAVKRGYPRGSFPGWRAFVKAFALAIPGLMAAVIIMGGILSGVFTATESSAIAVIDRRRRPRVAGSEEIEPRASFGYDHFGERCEPAPRWRRRRARAARARARRRSRRTAPCGAAAAA